MMSHERGRQDDQILDAVCMRAAYTSNEGILTVIATGSKSVRLGFPGIDEDSAVAQNEDSVGDRPCCKGS